MNTVKAAAEAYRATGGLKRGRLSLVRSKFNFALCKAQDVATYSEIKATEAALEEIDRSSPVYDAVSEAVGWQI